MSQTIPQNVLVSGQFNVNDTIIDIDDISPEVRVSMEPIAIQPRVQSGSVSFTPNITVDPIIIQPNIQSETLTYTPNVQASQFYIKPKIVDGSNADQYVSGSSNQYDNTRSNVYYTPTANTSRVYSYNENTNNKSFINNIGKTFSNMMPRKRATQNEKIYRNKTVYVSSDPTLYKNKTNSYITPNRSLATGYDGNYQITKNTSERTAVKRSNKDQYNDSKRYKRNSDVQYSQNFDDSRYTNIDQNSQVNKQYQQNLMDSPQRVNKYSNMPMYSQNNMYAQDGLRGTSGYVQNKDLRNASSGYPQNKDMRNMYSQNRLQDNSNRYSQSKLMADDVVPNIMADTKIKIESPQIYVYNYDDSCSDDDSTDVTMAYKNKIKKLESERDEISEKIKMLTKSTEDKFNTAVSNIKDKIKTKLDDLKQDRLMVNKKLDTILKKLDSEYSQSDKVTSNMNTIGDLNINLTNTNTSDVKNTNKNNLKNNNVMDKPYYIRSLQNDENTRFTCNSTLTTKRSPDAVQVLRNGNTACTTNISVPSVTCSASNIVLTQSKNKHGDDEIIDVLNHDGTHNDYILKRKIPMGSSYVEILIEKLNPNFHDTSERILSEYDNGTISVKSNPLDFEIVTINDDQYAVADISSGAIGSTMQQANDSMTELMSRIITSGEILLMNAETGDLLVSNGKIYDLKLNSIGVTKIVLDLPDTSFFTNKMQNRHLKVLAKVDNTLYNLMTCGVITGSKHYQGKLKYVVLSNMHNYEPDTTINLPDGVCDTVINIITEYGDE